MQINKTSWHYRLISFINYDMDLGYRLKNTKYANLCWYSRMLFWTLFLCVVYFICAISVFAAFAIPIVDMFYEQPNILVIIGQALWLSAFILLLVFLRCDVIEDKSPVLGTLPSISVSKPKFLGIFSEIYKSFKEKTCISIDLID